MTVLWYYIQKLTDVLDSFIGQSVTCPAMDSFTFKFRKLIFFLHRGQISKDKYQQQSGVPKHLQYEN